MGKEWHGRIKKRRDTVRKRKFWGGRGGGGEIRRRGRGKRGERKGEGGIGGGKNFLKLGFWNVAGIKGKDEEFWERIKGWD